MDIEKAEEYVFDKLDESLSDTLFYHGPHHTIDVSNAVLQIAIAEGIHDTETLHILQTAAFYHDLGFISTYQGHEEESCRLAKISLPDFEYSDEQIEKICGLIMATKIPQNPTNHLERIIADADLDYLGREDFWTISRSLYEELHAREMVTDIDSWNKIQISFLENHQYWTETAKQWRNPAKLKRIEELRKIIE
ncbi:HD domain-containing protein [Emticicia sp. C21]|uniref:HD domain-containing protein n=1 Tax=Emticicia sp. C21 TaxID=2302915 RepID=UPI000E34BB2E|nr:HD domain-containing protein [Emticicia sp. C21]RFS18076.1 HD domain-containing protein [Emticicia sp. C21]